MNPLKMSAIITLTQDNPMFESSWLHGLHYRDICVKHALIRLKNIPKPGTVVTISFSQIITKTVIYDGNGPTNNIATIVADGRTEYLKYDGSLWAKFLMSPDKMPNVSVVFNLPVDSWTIQFFLF